MGVPIGPQESFSDLGEDVETVAFGSVENAESACALTMSWIASFASLDLKYPYVSRAEQYAIAFGSMSTMLCVPNADGNAYTDPCARDQPSYRDAESAAARRTRPTPKSQLDEGGPARRVGCARLRRILRTCESPTMARREKKTLVGMKNVPREGLMLDKLSLVCLVRPQRYNHIYKSVCVYNVLRIDDICKSAR